MLSDDEKKTVFIAIVIPSALSFIASLLIIFIYIKFKDLQISAFKVIVYLSLFDALRSIAFMIPVYSYSSDSIICEFQSYFILISCQCCNIWTFFVGLYLYWQVCRNSKYLEIKLDICFVLSILTALITALIPFAARGVGYNIGWCEIKQDFKIYIFIVQYTPLCLFLAGNIYLYYRVIEKVKCQLNFEEVGEEWVVVVRKLKLYPLIGIVCLLPMLVEKIYNTFYNSDIILIFHVLAAFTMSVNGLLNAVIYGLNSTVRATIKVKVFRLTSYMHLSSGFTDSLTIYN